MRREFSVTILRGRCQTPRCNKSIGTALVEKEAATPGTDVVVHIRGTAYGAKVVELPFYKRSYKIGAA